MAGGAKGGRAELALAALLSEPTLARAAAKAGVSERTLRYWMRRPRFLRAYRRRRRQVVEAVVGRVQASMGEALDALRALLGCDGPAVRCRAALGLLEHGLRALEWTDTLDRVEQLEKRLAAREKAR